MRCDDIIRALIKENIISNNEDFLSFFIFIQSRFFLFVPDLFVLRKQKKRLYLRLVLGVIVNVSKDNFGAQLFFFSVPL
jgi:hypothetical protein